MVVNIMIPKTGYNDEPVEITEWRLKNGGKVEKGAVVLVFETEKISHQIEAETSGFLRILVEAGKDAQIGSTVGYIAETMEELAKL